MKNVFAYFVVFLSLYHAQAKGNNINEEPIIGKPCPQFVIKNIHYFNKSQASNKDFLGKWLVLDFWSKHCGACVASFPRINSEYKALRGQVQYIMVGRQDKEG